MEKEKVGQVIALLGAPGAGKSTCAAWLFANLRLAGARCELVGEFAKDLFWDESNAWKDQLYVFASQWRMVDRVLRKTGIVVTDSPPVLSLFYNRPHRQAFVDLVEDRCRQHSVQYFLLKRTVPYDQNGRRETEAEADAIHSEMEAWLAKERISCRSIDSDLAGWQKILSAGLKMAGIRTDGS